ncbi:MAG: T9SS type A sorting domain-containing protein [Ignavibacteriales bacterium]|nr:T9SS type A sorting domain-containing protein [Ignavibacteriales bacterium]
MKYLIKLILLTNLFSIAAFPQWIPQNSNTSQRLLTTFFLNEDIGWAGGNEGCIIKTTNGGLDWNYYSIGTKYTVHAIHFVDLLKGWAVLYTFIPSMKSYIIATSDGGLNWYYQYNIQNETLHNIFFYDENFGWAIGSGGVLLRTFNGGTNWQELYISDEWAWGLYFINSNTGWVGDGTSGYIKKTTDGGLTWDFYFTPTQSRIFGIKFIDASTGWAVGDNGVILNTNNGGINWNLQYSGTSLRLRDVDFIDENIGWAVGMNGVILHSTNGGSNWFVQGSQVSNDLFGLSCKSSQLGWIAGSNGIILKTENGGGDPLPVELISFAGEYNLGKVNLQWSTATELNNSGFEVERKTENDKWMTIGFVKGYGTTSEVNQYTFTENVFNISPKRFFYRLKQIDFNGKFEYSNEIEVDVNVPNKFHLGQNYPNPFNPITTINYQVPIKSKVTLKIFDILGAEVEVLVNEIKDAGFYDILFDASELVSGVYFYSMQTENYLNTKKLILIK